MKWNLLVLTLTFPPFSFIFIPPLPLIKHLAPFTMVDKRFNVRKMLKGGVKFNKKVYIIFGGNVGWVYLLDIFIKVVLSLRSAKPDQFMIIISGVWYLPGSSTRCFQTYRTMYLFLQVYSIHLLRLLKHFFLMCRTMLTLISICRDYLR